MTRSSVGGDGRPAVHVLSLGGTIGMASTAHGAEPLLLGSELVAGVPGLADHAAVTVETARQLPGASLSFDDLLDTAERARLAVTNGARGVAITQGTDTLEETCVVLDLVWDRPEPLVVTGAMRPPHVPGADGPANLTAAVVVAGAARARERGCLAVFGDEVHAARHVAKTHSSRLSAFASPTNGPVGLVTENRPYFWAPPTPRPAPLHRPDGRQPWVPLVTAVLGATGADVESAVRHGADGMVLAAMGGGHVPARMLPALATAVQRMPVAVASRTGSGPLLRHTYAFAGAERDLHELGVLDAGDLNPVKARALLVMALWAGPDREQAEAAFRHYAHAGTT